MFAFAFLAFLTMMSVGILVTNCALNQILDQNHLSESTESLFTSVSSSSSSSSSSCFLCAFVSLLRTDNSYQSSTANFKGAFYFLLFFWGGGIWYLYDVAATLACPFPAGWLYMVYFILIQPCNICPVPVQVYSVSSIM